MEAEDEEEVAPVAEQDDAYDDPQKGNTDSEAHCGL